MITITDVEIENFRSFKEKKNSSNFRNCLSANIITGKNNVGKTNILRAIYIFFYPDMYDPDIDMNHIKKITGGASKHPIITLSFKDDELERGREIKYSIKCDFNNFMSNKNNTYSCISRDSYFKPKLKSSKLRSSYDIKKYLETKFKCVYISTTDEIISNQANTALNDMILEYYKKRNKEVKDSIQLFLEAHSNLLSTFENNISFLQNEMAQVFNNLNSDGFDIVPKLELNSNLEITDFLLENLELKIDDNYVQHINSKGAGIQRASIILLNLFLLKNIYSRKNKIILLDEPEAYLYPLLVEKIKNELDKHLADPNFQLFITTHSASFLREMSNEETYKYYNVEQERHSKPYSRSKNSIDINKYSVVNQYDRKTKNQILRNYGLMNSIEDYEDVIVVEGETDKNYLEEIFKNLSIVPQIKYAKDFKNNNFIGKGASAVLHILSYLDDISDVQRKVFVLLDGDQEGKTIESKIKRERYKNLEVTIRVLDEDKVIEDYVYSRENLAEKLLEIEPEFRSIQNLHSLVKNVKYKSIIELLKDLIKLNNIGTDINKIKIQLSKNLQPDQINNNWIIEDIKTFFNIE